MCCIFATRRYKPSEHEAVNNDPSQAIAGLSNPKRKPSRLIKLNQLASTKPVQTRSAAIPLPPKYRSRGSNTPKVQDVTDPAIRVSLFGPFAQVDHLQHYVSGLGGRPDSVHRDSGCAGIRGYTRCGINDSTNSADLSSTYPTQDESGSGGHDISSHRSHEASGDAETIFSSFGNGHSVGYSDSTGGGDGGGIGGIGCI